MKNLYQITLLFIFLFSVNALLCAQIGAGGEKGIEAYNQGQYQEAADILQNDIKTNKKDQNAWLYLGMSLARLKQSSKAAKALRKADQLSGENQKAKKGEKQPIIISKPRAGYTDDARRNQTQGIIKLAVELGADGRINGVFPFQTLPDGLTKNCLKVAREIKFEPAVKDGKPISAIKIITYTFTIY